MGCCERGFHGVSAVEAVQSRALRAPQPFQPASVPAQYPPDVPILWHDLTLVVTVDVHGRRLTGTATYEGTVRQTALRRARFDADGIEVLRAFDGDGHRRPIEHDGRTLWVDLGERTRGDGVRISIDFDSRDPRAGFYFILPDADHPDRPAHAWTQGQDEDSRFWFPCHDSPNHKLRLHVLATVPDDMVALSNGALKDIYPAADAGWRTFDWQIARPIPTYLLTLAVGPFVEVMQREQPVPVSFWTLPGREADGERAFGRTPQMVDFFEQRLGVKYAYEKYSQVAVSEFVFGGMENASMTTQTDLTLHDARAHLDFSSEPLVSHELAHQWFGDLVTCRSWAHGWLNEGFATYFEELWREHTESADEFDYARLQAQRSYLGEDAGRYRRTIVTHRWREPIDVFDAHLYEKGASVLHMLRRKLGDDAFFGGLARYLGQHADGNVETSDLRRVLEDHSGVNLGRFFAQWVEEGAGHPEVKVSGAWDGDKRQFALTLEQTQDLEHAPLFSLEVPVLVLTAHAAGDPVNGEQRWTLAFDQKLQTFHLPLAEAPTQVLVDPRGDLLWTTDWRLSEPMLRTILRHGPTAIARMHAAAALGKRASAQNVAALSTALQDDASWCVQLEVARVLGKVGSTAAFDGLAAAVQLAHPKARRAVRAALGQFQTAAAGQLLAELLRAGDESYFVEAETALALGRTRSPLAFDGLVAALNRPGWNETVRVGVLDGLAALQNPRALDVIAPWLAKHHHLLLRCAAVRALCGFTSEPAQVVDRLAPWTADVGFRFALTMAASLGGLGDGRAIRLLQVVAERAVDGRIKRRAEESMAQVRAGLGAGKQVDGLRGDLDSLRNAVRELTDRVAAGEALKTA
jgi:aminopeptidase N